MNQFEDVQTQKSFKYLQEVETVAQNILTAKENRLRLSNAQNKFREALRALEEVEDRTSWLEMNSVYVERPTEECKMILREELAKIEQDLDEVHNEIRQMVHKLQDLEHEPGLVGFSLKPISAHEAKTLHKAFGLS